MDAADSIHQGALTKEHRSESNQRFSAQMVAHTQQMSQLTSSTRNKTACLDQPLLTRVATGACCELSLTMFPCARSGPTLAPLGLGTGPAPVPRLRKPVPVASPEVLLFLNLLLGEGGSSLRTQVTETPFSEMEHQIICCSKKCKKLN